MEGILTDDALLRNKPLVALLAMIGSSKLNVNDSEFMLRLNPNRFGGVVSGTKKLKGIV